MPFAIIKTGKQTISAASAGKSLARFFFHQKNSSTGSMQIRIMPDRKQLKSIVILRIVLQHLLDLQHESPFVFLRMLPEPDAG